MNVGDEVFSLRGSPSNLPCHGSAVLGAHVSAQASQRGISLGADAQIDIQVDADAAIGKGIRAAVAAGADIGVGGVIEAVFPMDFFHEAGFVSRLEIKAEAAGFVRAALELPAEEVVARVRQRVPASLQQLVDEFVEEVVVEAGLWGRAGLAIEIFGELALTGSLISAGEHGPGYTFTLRYGAGIGFCSGVHTQINIGIAEPGRLLQRLAAVSTGVLERRLRDDPQAGPAEAAAVGYIRLLLPLAARSLFEVGFRIANGADGADATRAVGYAFLVEARTLLIRAIVDTVGRRIGESMGNGILRQALRALGTDDRQAARVELQTVRARLQELGNARGDDLRVWVPAVMDTCSALSRLVSLRPLAGQVADELADALAVLWTAGALAEQLASWSTKTRDGAIENLNGLVAARPGPIIAQRIGVEPGTDITTAQLVDFLLVADPIDEIRLRCPELGQVLDLVEEILADVDGASTFGKLLRPGPLDDAACAALVVALGTRLPPIMDAAFERLGQRFPPGEDTTLLGGIAAPIVAAIPGIVIPNLGNIDNAAGRRRLLEGISAVLFQAVQHLVLSTVDAVLERALTDGEERMRDVADNLQSSQVNAVIGACERGLLGMTMTRADIADLLRVSADVVHLLNVNEREPVVEVARALVALGLDTDATRAESFHRLVVTDDAPQPASIRAALDQVASGAWSVFKDVFPKSLAILANHMLRILVEVAQAIAKAARVALDAVRDGIAALVGAVEDLGEKLLEYADEAGELVARMAGSLDELAGYLLDREDNVLNSIGNHVRSAMLDFISWAPGPVQDGARALFNGLFNAVKYLLEAPLRVLGAVADFVHDAIMDSLADGGLSKSSILDVVRDGIHDWGASALSIHIKVDLGLTTWDVGTLHIPGHEVLEVIAEAVCADDFVEGVVDQCIAVANQLRSVQANQAITEAALAEERTREELSNELLAHATEPPAIRIVAPANQEIFQVQTIVVLRVQHANATFVGSSLGVPRRARVYLNGEDYPYEPTDWRRTGDGLMLRAIVTRKQRSLVPHVIHREPMALSDIAPEAGDNVPSGTLLGTRVDRGRRSDAPHGDARRVGVTGAHPLRSSAERRVRARAMAMAVVARDPQRVATAKPVGARLPTAVDIAQGFLWELAGADEDLPVLIGKRGANLISLVVADGTNNPPDPVTVTFFLE